MPPREAMTAFCCAFAAPATSKPAAKSEAVNVQTFNGFPPFVGGVAVCRRHRNRNRNKQVRRDSTSRWFLKQEKFGSHLKDHIDAFIASYNENAAPFVWTKAKVHQRSTSSSAR